LHRLEFMSAKTKHQELAAALNLAVPSRPQQPEQQPAAVETPAAPSRRAAPSARTKKRGKNVHFFLHDEDTRLIRELATWLSGQGERPNDSLVVRSAIRAVKADAHLLKCYRQAIQLDGRLKQHRDDQ
jgi:hypothetical protein